MIYEGNPRLSPRFAVLPLAPHGTRAGYVIFDRHTARITDGVYLVRDDALAVATFCEQRGSPAVMTPTAEALGLLFPVAALERR